MSAWAAGPIGRFGCVTWVMCRTISADATVWARSTVDFLLRARRGKVAARRYFEKAIGNHGEPETVTIDKSGQTALECCRIVANRGEQRLHHGCKPVASERNSIMPTVTIGIASRTAVAARFVSAMNGEQQGAYITEVVPADRIVPGDAPR